MPGDVLRRNTFAPLAVAVAILCGGAVGLSVAYHASLQNFETSTLRALGAAASAAALSQDPDGFAFVTGPEDADSIPSRASQSALKRIVQGMPDIDAACLYVRSGGSYVAFASATAGKGPHYEPYTPVEAPPAIVGDTFKSGGRTTSLAPTTDSYGTWLESCSPVIGADGETAGVVLVRSSHADYLAQKAHIARSYELAGGLVLLAAIGLAWPFFWLVRTPKRVLRYPKRRIMADIGLVVLGLYFLSVALRPLTADKSPTEIWSQMSQDGGILFALSAAILAGATVLTRRRLSATGDRLQTVERQGSTAEAQYRGIVESLPVGLAIFEGSTAVFTNDVLQHQFGSGERIANSDQLVRRLQSDDKSNGEALAAAIALATPSEYDLKVDNGDQQDSTYEVHVVPIYEPNGLCRQTLVYSIDLTSELAARQTIQEAYEELGQKNTMLSSALAGLEENLQSVVHSLVKAVEAKDPYTAGHSERVMRYSLWLGEQIGLGPYELRILELGTLIHDVGKIGIPDEILTKPDRLTPEEYDVIKLHPVFGVEIIKNISMFKECIPIVRSHHERLDGMGYPDGLKGDEISVLVRISSIADIFDAMTSTRAYRDGMPLEKVLAIMDDIAMKGEIDAQLFSVFCMIIRERGIIPQESMPRSAA